MPYEDEIVLPEQQQAAGSQPANPYLKKRRYPRYNPKPTPPPKTAPPAKYVPSQQWVYKPRLSDLRRGRDEYIRRQPLRQTMWQNPWIVSRYHKTLQALPPGTEPPPWMDREQIDLAYEYMRQRNNGAPEWQWKYLPPDDPGMEFIRGIPTPPAHALWPGEEKYSGKSEAWQEGYRSGTTGWQGPRSPDWYAGQQAAQTGTQPVSYQTGEYQPAEYETLTQPGMGGMTEEQYDLLRPWQKALVAFTGAPGFVQAAGMGGAIGLFAGGPAGALVGTALGAGLGGLAQISPTAANALMYLDYPAEWFERALGMLELGYGRGIEATREGGFLAGADAVAEVLNNLPAAWQAAHLTYETLPVGRTWQLYEPEPTPNQGWQAFNEAFERIRQGGTGNSPQEVWDDIAGRMGVTGQGRELLGHILLDPLNVLGGLGILGELGIARFTNNPYLDIAARSAESPIQALRNYGAILRSIAPDIEVSKMGGFSRWLGGVDAAGQATDVAKKGGKGIFHYLFSLTPQARATEVVNNSATVVSGVLDRARQADGTFDPKLALKYLHGMANTPTDLARELSMKAIQAPDAASIPLALKDNIDHLDDIAVAWEASQPRLSALQKIGELTSRELEEIILELGDEAGARRILAQVQDIAARSDAPEAQELLAAIEGPQPGLPGLDKLDAKALQELAEPFQGKEGLPTRPEFVKAKMQAAIEDVTAQWAVDWFGVKPDPGWVRMANTVKSAQSLVLLGFNPTYFLNNTINNLVTVTAEGLFGVRTPGQIASIWSRAGITPPRLRAGIGVDASGLEQAHRVIREAATGEGALEVVRGGLEKTRRWQVFGRLSGWNERAASEQAVTSGFTQWMSRIWRPDVGFSRMPDPLEQRLAAIDPDLPRAVYSLIQDGWNQAEIEQKLWRGLTRRSVSDAVPEISRRTGLPEADVAEALAHAGANSPETAEALARATTQDEINDVLSGIERQAQDHLDRLNAQNLELEARKAAARVGGEGAQAALEIFDQMSFDYSEHWFQHFVRTDEAAQVAERLEGPARSMVWENLDANERREWNRLNQRQEAQMAGVANGLGLESDTGRRMVGYMQEQHNTWNDFYGYRRQQHQAYGRGEQNWETTQTNISRAYEEAYTRQEAALDAMDTEYASLFAAQFGEEAGTVAAAWRQGIKDIRQKMHTDMVTHRAQGEQSWREFLRGPYFDGIRSLYEQNVEGARQMWSVATGGQEPPPAPAAPEAPEFTDIDWKLGGSDLAEGMALRAARQAEAQDANVRAAEIRQIAAELAPEQLATATPEGQPRNVDRYILNVINKYGEGKYDDIAEVEPEAARKAIAAWQEKKAADVAQAEEARKAQQALDFEAAIENRPGIERLYRSINDAIYRTADPKTNTPDIDRVVDVAVKNTKRFTEAEVRELAQRLIEDATDESGKLIERPIGAQAGGLVNMMESDFSLRPERPSLQEAGETMAAKLEDALADIAKETPATQARRLYDEGMPDAAFEMAMDANKTTAKQIIKAVPELEQRINYGRKMLDNLHSGNLDALPEDLRNLVGEAVEVMRLELEQAEQRSDIFIEGKYDSTIESSYPAWYAGVAGSYKGMPKNKDAVLEALKDITVKNLPEGSPPAVVKRIMRHVQGALETQDVYRKLMGYDIDVSLELTDISRSVKNDYLPDSIAARMDDLAAIEARITDFYDGPEMVPDVIADQLAYTYEQVLRRFDEIDQIDKPPKPDPYIEEQAQLLEAGRVAQAEWVDDVQQALPEEDRRTNLELRQEIDRLRAQVGDLQRDPLTKLPVYQVNREPVDSAPVKMMLDVSGLKYVNDTYGETAGDALIIALADTTKNLGFDVYRRSARGDEFLIPFNSLDEAQAAEAAIKQAMAEAPVAAGETTLTGFPVHIGYGDSIEAAEDGLNASKRAANLARGGKPAGVVGGPDILEQPSRQMDMFGAGEDLPLMTGTPMTARESVFRPQEAARQGTLFDMRPQPKGAIEGGEAAGPLFDASLQVGQIRNQLRKDFITHFLSGQEQVLAGVEDAGRQADAVLALLDAHANVWAKQTGLTPLDWYRTHIAGFGREAPTDDALLQLPLMEQMEMRVANAERALDTLSLEQRAMVQSALDDPRRGWYLQRDDPEAWAVYYELKSARTAFENPQVFYQQEASPIWYHQLQRVVEGIPQEKMSVEQLRGMIAKGGVKADELKWAHLDEYLDEINNSPLRGEDIRIEPREQPAGMYKVYKNGEYWQSVPEATARKWLAESKGQVSREGLLDYLRQNQVEVREVVKGQEPAIEAALADVRERRIALSRSYEEMDELIISIIGEEHRDKFRTHGIYHPEVQQALRDRGVNPQGYIDQANDYTSQLHGLDYEEENLQRGTFAPEGAPKYEDPNLVLPGYEPGSYRELLLTMPMQPADTFPNWMRSQEAADIARTQFGSNDPYRAAIRQDMADYYNENIKPKGQSPYQSTHWQEPNVLAHVRFDDRVDADGKRVLFIEEVQSDWHQVGREEGYITPEIQARIKELEVERNRWGVSPGPQASAKYKQLTREIDELRSGVPDAPFSKTWPELTMKRMLRWAAENGYDRVAWTTGDQQADRYNLAKYYDAIRIERLRDVTPPGEPLYNVFTKRGETWDRVATSTDRLADYVGQDLAAKALDINPGERQDYTGLDLKVGGEGMRTFYDQMLPKAMDKYAKKWGVRTGETRIAGPSKLSEEIGFLDARLGQENGQWVVEVFDGDEWNASSWWDTRADAEAEISTIKVGRTENLYPVHSLDITPEMKASVMQGQPLFQGARGAVQFLDDGRAILHALQSPDVSTLAHEVGHIFRRDLTPDDLAITEKWAGVIDGRWEVEAEEKFAKGFEAFLAEGKAPTKELANVFEQFKTWIAHIYARMREYFTGSEINDDMRGVYNRLLAENPDAYEYNITTQTGRAKQGTLFQPAPPPESANFRNWFGDSKVVDENGRPLPVYHGTASDFQEFDIGRAGTATDVGYHGRGFYFSASPTVGDIYATSAEYKGGNANIMPVYLSMQNPYHWGRKTTGVYGMSRGMSYEIPGDIAEAVMKRAGYTTLEYSPRYSEMIARDLSIALTDELKSRGYDGVIVDNSAGQPSEFLVFDPQQVKSTYNQGTFDPNNPNILYQEGNPTIQFEDGRTTPIENNPPDAVKNPLGAVDSLHNEAPLHRLEEDGFAQNVRPVLDGLRAYMNDPNTQLPEAATDLGAKLDPATARALRGYMAQVYGQLSDTKLAGVRVAETRRDAALLNYSRRYGIDNLLMSIMPYNFWYTRSALNWALRTIDKPSWLANYYRLRSIGAGMQENEGYPQRLRNKMRIPMPWLPDWMGKGVYVDPLRQMFPLFQLAQPFERLADQNNMIARRAVFVLQDWAEEDSEDPRQVSDAIQERAGPLWEKAIAQAKLEIDEEIENPLDFVNTISGFSLPINWAYQWMRGKKDRIGPLPITRLVKNVTSLAGLNQGRGYNLEGGLRRALGMPEYDRWTDYRVDRMLSNMVAEGVIDTDTAQRAMIDRGQGQDDAAQAFLEAERRVSQQAGAIGLVGGPFQADLFPEGEQRQRAIKNEYSKAAEAWRGGDEEALTNFFEKYPEYEARLALYKEPEQRLKSYLVGEVWDRYMGLPDLHRKQASEQMGQLFQEAFLNKETRSYDSIDTDTLAYWARQLGSDAIQKIQQQPQADLDLADPQLAAAYQELQDERDRMWPDIGSKLNLYYSLPPEIQGMYEQNHPEINEYQTWRTQYLADNPQVIPYAISEDNKVAGAKPEIQGLYYQYLATRDRQFPGVLDLQSAYYDNGKPKGFLKQNPMLTDYWDWRRTFLAQHPDMIPYIVSTETLARSYLGDDYQQQAMGGGATTYTSYGTPTREVTLTPSELAQYPPALIRQLMAYFYQGQQLGAGARKELHRLWERSGRGGKFEDYLAGPVRYAVVNR